MTHQPDLFVPPAAEGLPPGALDSATEGADRLDAVALTPNGRNLLAHALVQLARDGWLRTEPGEGVDPVPDRVDVPHPQDPANLRPLTAEPDAVERREEVLYFLECRAADGRWESPILTLEDPDEANRHLARARGEMPHFEYRVARQTTTVVVQPLPETTTYQTAGAEPSDPTQCSGEEGFCPEHGFHRHSLKQPGQPEPCADQSALRNRIAEALYAHDHPGHLVPLNETGMGPAYQESADAALAALPASVDPADVLREEAARIRAHCPDHLDADSAEGSWMVCHCDVADDMERRVAAETPNTTEAHPPTSTWKVESPRREQWASWGATYDDREWAQERYESAIENASARPFRLVRATTTYTVEAEHTPAAQQPKEA